MEDRERLEVFDNHCLRRIERLTAAIGFRAQFSANAFSFQLYQLFCCGAVFVGSITLPTEHLVNLCES